MRAVEALASLENQKALVVSLLGEGADIEVALSGARERLTVRRRPAEMDDKKANYALWRLLANLPPPTEVNPLVDALVSMLGPKVYLPAELAKAVKELAKAVKELLLLPGAELSGIELGEAQLRLCEAKQADLRASVEEKVAKRVLVVATLRPGMTGYTGGQADSRCALEARARASLVLTPQTQRRQTGVASGQE
jgi:hypothetical protein